VEEGAFETFPYGHVQPTVTCAPLRACVIELESGESVLSKIAGDTQRWEIQLALAGTDGRTPLVVVKPHDCGLTTNLVLATTAGRIYDLTLDSPPCPRSGLNPRGFYAPHVRFYYPDAMVEAWSAPPPPIAQATANIGAFNFAYRVTRERHVPWVPIAVFDDGAHCYIKLPPAAAHREAPALFAVAEDGSKILLNYNLVGDSYVTDRVFRAAVLVVGESGRERVVRLDNLRYDATVSGDDGTHDDRPVAPLGRGR
jgi:type IV secretion system protein VirB9